ncbi:MAG: TIGR01777 family protein [Candidatus Omnitrophica bacterium]|nr:TIGR01777 family protein [Candidatus Omnitrophota bacterium]
MKVVLAGATGFIGKTLIRRLLERGDSVVLLTRSRGRVQGIESERLQSVVWNGVDGGAWESALQGADGVMNLCGESIAGGRWTPERKRQILESRVNSTRALVRASSAAASRPKVLVNASGIGYYGSGAGNEELTEQSPLGKGFLAETCAAWEREALGASALGMRVVLARIGIVLEKDGGALEKMLTPFLFFAGGPLGSGRQWFPWVHREDAVGLLLWALDQGGASGPMNVCSPQPVTMKEFAAVLGRVLGRPSWFPVPALLLKLILGEMAELLLDGHRAVPAQAIRGGYRFKFPSLEPALKNILSR